jgi:hypothetical protein
VLVAAWAPAQAFTVLTRDSSVQAVSFALNTPSVPCSNGFGGVLATATSLSLSSAADLAVAGTGCYQDGFGRHYEGSYAATQDVTFGPSLVQAQMAQALTVDVLSPGWPEARVPSLSAANNFDLELSFSGATTLRLDVLYQGVASNLTAWDFVRLSISAQTSSGLPAGGLFDLNGNGVLSGVPFSTTLTIHPNPDFRYFLAAVASARANADEYATGSLSFTVSAVPEPGSWALMTSGLALVAWLARRRKAGP